MPTVRQYETVKQQVLSFGCIGCAATLKIQKTNAPSIVIYNSRRERVYHFCDPDWNVVSMQLSKLYMRLKKC